MPRYVLVLICMFAILGSNRLAATTVQAQDRASVSIGDNFFEPADLTIPTGGVLTWTHAGTDTHTVISPSGLFDSGDLRPGDVFTYTFADPGDYVYFCVYHPGQAGVIHVGAMVEQALPSQEALTLEPIATLESIASPESIEPSPPTPTSEPLLTPTIVISTPTIAPTTVELTATPEITATPTPTSTVTPTVLTPTATRSGAAPTSVEIVMQGLTFSPYSVTLSQGATVTFTNRDRIAHTAVGGGFNTGIILAGQSKTVTFPRTGAITYHCAIHGAQMSGHLDIVPN